MTQTNTNATATASSGTDTTCPVSGMNTGSGDGQCPFASTSNSSKRHSTDTSKQCIKEEPIPQPEPHFLVGNIFTVDKKNPFPSFIELAKKFDGIFKMDMLGKQIVVVYGQEYVNELCDESRFQKALPPGLKHVKEFGGDGLFTAGNEEPNWALAHRILVPAFGPKSIQDMFPQMYDIAEQLCTKWERLGEHSVIDIVDNMTRLTLDTIALCAFTYRFNSFYHNEMHPFVQSMFEALQEASSRTKRPSLLNNVMVKTKKKHQRNIDYMHAVADEIVKERKKNPNSSCNDLLNRMLLGKDPITGQGLSDENIRYQMVTFLIAGHETTSGLLSFAIYELLKHPEALKKAQMEVDSVIGNETIQIKHISQLVYLDQILKEVLRLWPTAPGFGLGCKTDQVIGGKYRIHPSDVIIVSNSNLHRDKKVWGEDCEQFNPDRMSPEKFSALPSNSWKPFGNGSRACIGRPFAWQEAILVLAMVLQRFELIENDPNYHLSITQALTIKPNGLFLKVKPRPNWKGSQLVRTNISSDNSSKSNEENSTPTESKGPLLVLYGSNSGTCESFASMLHQDAKSKGFDCKVGRLNTFTGNIPLDTPIIVVTASYEGQPTEDAKQFVGWLEHVPENTFKGLKYAVFGCGHSDWVDTYQRIPTFIDNRLSEAGGERIVQRGAGNAAKDLFSEFDQWRKVLWTSFDPHSSSHSLPPVETTVIKGHRETILHFQSLEPGKVVDNYDLVPEDYCDDHGTCRSKRHIEIQLPSGANYESGDYLSVLPVNCMKVVNKALSHFNLTHDDQIVLKRSEMISSTPYPVNEPISAVNLFMNYFELSQPATKRQLEILLEHTKEESDKKSLQQLIDNTSNIPPILDIVHDLKSCQISLGTFLDISIPMRTRQYSISSSPLWNKNKCTITVGVLRAPATHGKGFHEGVASNFLASCLPDMQVSVQIRNSSFKLPQDPSVPVIMIGAGTGIAPFRGFVQERAYLIKEGKTLGKALLFQGCRNPEQDYLYKKELEEWSQLGAVELRPVFSRIGNNVKYVQDKIWECKEEVGKLLLQEAQIYICGEGNHMAPAVKKVLMEIYQEVTNCTKEEAEKRMSSMDKRFAVDVFA